MLGQSRRGWHVSAVAWIRHDGAGPQLLEVGRLLAEVCGRRPITGQADTETVWAWMSFPGEPALDLRRLTEKMARYPEPRIAPGEPDTGLTGFRTSHQEALRTREVADVAETSERHDQQYRVRKAEELLGRPITDDRLSVEMALLACDQLAATTHTIEPAETER